MKKKIFFSLERKYSYPTKKSNSICMILSDQKNGIYNFFQVMYAYIMYNKAIKVENNNNHKNEIKFNGTTTKKIWKFMINFTQLTRIIVWNPKKNYDLKQKQNEKNSG